MIENYVDLKTAGKKIMPAPRSFLTMKSYAQKGVRSADGKRIVKLRAFKMGATWLTTQANCEKFLMDIAEPTVEQQELATC